MSNETKNLATTQSGGSLERPAFLQGEDSRGTSHLTKDDIQMPRLALAQSLTPQVADAKEGFTTGVLFNSLTEEILGKGPLEFTVVRADAPRYIEFIPRDEGGGIRDYNVAPTDPRTQFTKDPETGKSIPPIATKFYDYIILMLPATPENFMDKIIALSLKSSGLKVAKTLNGLMRLRNAASFAGKYVLTTEMTQNAKGKFAIYKVKNAGWVDEPTYHLAEQVYETLKDREIKIDRDENPDDADPEAAAGSTDFNPHQM